MTPTPGPFSEARYEMILQIVDQFDVWTEARYV